MKRSWNLVGTMLCAFALACGGGAEEADSEHSSGGEHQDEHHLQGEPHEHAHHGHHGGEFGPALTALHDAFAPLWHGERTGPVVCPEAANLAELAAAAGAEHTEHPDEGAALTESAQAFLAQCQATPDGGPEFDASFDTFHNAMHAVMHTPPH
jgi:hypothetical protein